MSEIWSSVPLLEFCSFISGSGFPEHLQGRENGELPFYKVSDMSSLGNERFLLAANNYVSKDLARNRGWKIAPANAVVFAKVGAALLLNRRRQLSTESIIDNNMVAVVANGFTTNEWLYWQLLRVDFADFVQDGALPSINQRQLGEVPIPKVVAAEALAVTNILDTLDTVIHETGAIIGKLKALKRGLLHDLLTRGIDANGKLRPPQTEAQHLYKESPLGWIPNEWEAIKLAALVSSIGQGWSPDCESRIADPGSWGVLKTTAITWAGYNDQESKELPPIFKARTDLEVKAEDILITRAGPASRVGVVAYVESTREKLMISDKMYRVRALPTELPAFVALALSSQVVQTELGRALSGMAESQTNISQAIVKELVIMRPLFEEQSAIVDRVRASENRIREESDYLEKLKAFKAGLMDDLLTGRVRVTPLLNTSNEQGAP